MSTISNVTGNIAQAYETSRTAKDTKTRKSSADYGKTIGTPELSEKAQKYYEELKEKYSDMDFILVSEDMKETAQAQAGSYANANRMVVLIDEDKIERMAEDSDYRKQYEGIIQNAAMKLPELKSSLGTTNVKTYGMQVNDNGMTSYFAILEKSNQAQQERVAKNAEKKAEKKKAAKKKAEKEEAEERTEQAAEKRRTEREALQAEPEEDTVIITASSIEELLQKIQDYEMEQRSDNVWTDEEKMIGQHIDYQG